MRQDCLGIWRVTFFLFVYASTASAQFDTPPPYECSSRGSTPSTSLPPLCIEKDDRYLSNRAKGITDAYCQPLSLTPLTEAEARSLFEQLHADRTGRVYPGNRIFEEH